MLLRQIYNLLLTLLVPPAALYLKLHKSYPPLLNRFNPQVPDFTTSPIWIHAASLGEVNIATPLIRAIQARWPETPILLTTSTLSGMEQARTSLSDIAISWCPFDHAVCVRRFIRRTDFRCLVLIETELWPNLLYYAHKADLPVTTVNGRISAKHFKRYSRVRGLFHPLLSTFAVACMQTPLDAERMQYLGLNPENTALTGNIKFDGAITKMDHAKQKMLKTSLNLTEDTPILIFGSTRPGEESLAVQCWETLKDRFPDLHLIIVPRHPKRIADAVDPFKSHLYLLRSEVKSGDQAIDNQRVLFVDVMGELDLFYSIATVAVVGGSFSEDVQGHNPIEPAALGVPTLFGPYMKNFQVPAEILCHSGGAIQVDTLDELQECIADLLLAPKKSSEMGKLGQAAVIENRGAIQKTLECLSPFIAAG